MLIKCFLFLLILVQTTLLGQEKFLNELRHYHLNKAQNYSTSLNREIQPHVSWQISFLRDFNTTKPDFLTVISLDKPNDGGLGDFYYHINNGDYYFYNFLDKNINAMQHYKNALQLGKTLENKYLICEALKKILTLYRIFYLYNNETHQPFLAEYKIYAYDELELAYYHYYNLILNFKNYETARWSPNSKKYLDKFLRKNDQPYLKGIAHTVYASYFEEMNQYDSLWKYALSAQKSLKSIPYNYKGSRLNQINSFMSRIALQEDNFEAAARYTQEATKIKYNSTDDIVRSLGHYQKAIVDSANGNYQDAMRSTLDYRKSMAIVEKAANNDLFNDLEVKYQTAEKEKQLLISEEEKNRNKNIAIALGGTVFFIALLSILFYKNAKKKQRIAEQERELEIQKKERILKEQELATIDAMISGQERERQRLAADLHDSVGSTIAAAKLQFHHLSSNRNNELDNTDILFEKTAKLLEEAYNEVRNMAHIKNSGVIAKNGLLPAVENLAKSASGINGLHIDVEHFGLEDRLENTLEISIFRIIQELVTNIIKHSKASEASISINQYKDVFNLIVEDNGNGFDARHLPKKEGMGLSSIEKRVEHLDGTMDVDSTIGKGTHILIDIPL